MIRFPPARIPLDPSTGIEPFPSANKGNTSDSLTLRGDKQIYYNGLLALQGKRFITDDGKYIEILKGPTQDGLFRYFYWDGVSRCIKTVGVDQDLEPFMELLSEAWPFTQGEGNSLYDEAQRRLQAALAYDPARDIDLIIENFDLLIRNTDRILANPLMRNGSLGSLYTGFIYFGIRRFSVSALLAAWKEGIWTLRCDRGSKKKAHTAYILKVVGGLSIGSVDIYCPTCNARWKTRQAAGSLFAAIQSFVAEQHNGYRLDEIIEELKKGD